MASMQSTERYPDQRRRLSRRRLILAGAGGGAALFALACGGDDDDGEAGTQGTAAPAGGTAAAAATPKAGGQFREATITQAPHFSPFHPGADPSFVNTWRRINGYYDTLWTFKAVNAAELVAPRLAASIEQPDQTTYVVKMHPSNFQNRPPANGREVTAEDQVEVIKFLSKPPATGGSFLQSGKDLKSATAVDKLTLRFETHGPRAFFFEEGLGVANTARVIVPKEMLDEQTLKQQIPVGSGPYEYKTHTQGSIEEIKAFTGYRIKDRPYIAEKKLTFVPDSAAIEAAFRANQIDWMGFSDIKQRDSVTKDLGKKVESETYPSESGMALVVNVFRDPWKDARAREAIHRAIDIDRVVNTVYFGDGTPTWYFSPANFEAFPIKREQVNQYVGYDPKKAGELLRASGADLSKEYEFMVPIEAQTWVDSARLMAEDLEKIGLKTRINPVVRNIYLQRGGPEPGDFDMQMSVLLGYRHAKTDAGTFWNSTALNDPEIDAFVEKVEATVNAQERKKLSEEFQIMLARKYSNLIPILTTNVHNAWYAYLKGFNTDFRKFGGWQVWPQGGRWLDN
jgi:peptide/nickel transport system substrate-binding protein